MKTGKKKKKNRKMGKIKEEKWFGKMRFSGRGARGMSADADAGQVKGASG